MIANSPFSGVDCTTPFLPWGCQSFQDELVKSYRQMAEMLIHRTRPAEETPHQRLMRKAAELDAAIAQLSEPQALQALAANIERLQDDWAALKQDIEKLAKESK